MLTPVVARLEAVARNWSKVAQPIQMSAKARGIRNHLSQEVAFKIRELALELTNKHGMVEQSQRLTGLIEELFSESPEVAEQVKEDSEALARVREQRKNRNAESEESAQEISYQADIGILLKKHLSISPAGIVWKGKRFELDAITRLRWGTRNTKEPTYLIEFGDDRSITGIKLESGAVFRNFTDRLWKAVGVRLLLEMLEELRDGGEIRFHDIVARDDGVTLTKRNILGANQLVDCTWGQVHIWTRDGTFCIGKKDDKRIYVGLSYLYQMNAHILEQAIRVAFKKPGLLKLSDVLR